MNIRIEKYDASYESRWDDFVLNKSMNGTFLQTRRFLNYHPDGRFQDCSLMVFKGDALVAVIPGCREEADGKTVFFSHAGTTYGGLVICKDIYSASYLDGFVAEFLQYVKQDSLEGAFLKQTPLLFQNKDTELLDYMLYKHGFQVFDELNYYLVLDKYKEDILSNFSSSKRRDYRYSLKNELVFKELVTPDDIRAFHEVLTLNYKKLGIRLVHTPEELIEFKEKRLSEIVSFYGVYKDNQMLAASMIFQFPNRVFHTQYLCSNEEYLKLFPMDFLIYNLIDVAVKRDNRLFTFGICTEDRGRYLNLGLSKFKEGFGTEFSTNKSYEIFF